MYSTELLKAVTCARNLIDDVEFSLEDAGRSDFEFMVQVIEKAIKAGASTINIPDTVGYTYPEEYSDLIRRIINTVSNADQAIFSTHCHNDLGLAVANSLAGISSGARQVECTINGLGERAGNAALEEIVMAVNTRKDICDVTTRIKTCQLVSISKLVSMITGFPVQPNKAIVGKNAFAHESGIHQDGMLKHPQTYEIMRAEDVGWRASVLVLGKHSGRNAVKDALKKLGIQIDDKQQFDELFVRFKNLADKKHTISAVDLYVLVGRETDNDYKTYQLKELNITYSTANETPRVCLSLLVNNELKQVEQTTGCGLVDATFKAIEKVINSNAMLQCYSVDAITESSESQGTVSVRLCRGEHIVNGIGIDTDIIVASAKSYLHALNLLDNENIVLSMQKDGI